MSDAAPQGWLERLWSRIRRTAQPEVPRPADALHWSPEQTGYPLCNARLGSRWTIEPEAATCPKCREMAATIVLQHRLGAR